MANKWLKKSELGKQNNKMDNDWWKDFFYGVAINNITSSEFTVETKQDFKGGV